MVDIISISILFGIFLVFIYWIKSKKKPPLATALAILLYGQAIVNGTSLILYGITANSLFFVNNRWVIAFGGSALLWIGFDNYMKNLKKVLKLHNKKIKMAGRLRKT